MVTRWREERARARGRNNDDAVRVAMNTAGTSVLFSGVTVAVSLAALIVVPLPFLRSIGLGGLLIPLLSFATSVTLVPALLSAFGPRLQWPRKAPSDGRSRFWAGVARAVLRRRWLTIVGSSAALLALAAPVVGLTLGSPQLDGLESTASAAGTRSTWSARSPRTPGRASVAAPPKTPTSSRPSTATLSGWSSPSSC